MKNDKPKMETTLIRFETRLMKRLRRFCKRSNVSMVFVLRQATEWYLDKAERIEEIMNDGDEIL